jgi:aconitate hydratase
MPESSIKPAAISVGSQEYAFYPLDSVADARTLHHLPYSLKVLLENLLRHADSIYVSLQHIDALLRWKPLTEPTVEIAFVPARVILQDFTGVPAIVDLAAMRDAVETLGGDPRRINPLAPAELVIDHSVQVDIFGRDDARDLNTRIEFQRNRERYGFLRWGQQAFDNFKVVPPGTGIVHQVNLEYLARVVFRGKDGDPPLVYPDTLVGTDSHTTMINGLGVLGWGVGGIEAEAAMLGQPITMLIPQVVGFRLDGALRDGATATDLVLTITEILRRHDVVGKFVEFYGDGLGHLPVADRATIANMAPEYGATCGLFPIDDETLQYLHLTGRPAKQVALVEAYARRQGLFRVDGSPQADYSKVIELDLSTIEPSLAGPRRPQDRIALTNAKQTIVAALHDLQEERGGRTSQDRDLARFADEGGGTAVDAEEALHSGVEAVTYADQRFDLRDGAVVIAAITSCTNTSNPAVMIGAGLLARNARRRGLRPKPWVKTSLAPGSLVVRDYLEKAGLLNELAALGFQIVGYGCTTCIGNSGPLPEPISDATRRADLLVCSVLSGNRNFEGRIHPDVRMNFLASPPLVIAYALAGAMDIDIRTEPLGEDLDGKPVFLRDIWPSPTEITATIADAIDAELFRARYRSVFDGDDEWRAMATPDSQRYAWDAASSYIRRPPYFDGMTREPEKPPPITGARVLCVLGDSVTTDHISPAGAIMADSPAGRYLLDQGVEFANFNSYGSRRGNHEVMIRGTFANIRLHNHLAPGTEGGWTRHQPDDTQMTIYEAAMQYREEGVPLLVIAGLEYGSGSSRDWAAKGTMLLGVRAVIAQSYERIHRSNLIGMGVLPLQFRDGESPATLGLDGTEAYDIGSVGQGASAAQVSATQADGTEVVFDVRIRIDTPMEWDYYRHGGILPYVLRQMLD